MRALAVVRVLGDKLFLNKKICLAAAVASCCGQQRTERSVGCRQGYTMLNEEGAPSWPTRTSVDPRRRHVAVPYNTVGDGHAFHAF